ncbi:MAG: hypothetical protein Q8L55_13455, partial [Phycisphaerales bacterium]|nr:hypothetical protein [Phycisphaerales bacterium]
PHAGFRWAVRPYRRRGRGADVMMPMAIPSVGGMAISLITLFIVPCVFSAVEEWKWKRAMK